MGIRASVIFTTPRPRSHVTFRQHLPLLLSLGDKNVTGCVDVPSAPVDFGTAAGTTTAK